MGFLAALPAIGGIASGVGSLFSGLFGGSSSQKASQQYIQALQQAQSFLGGQEKQGLGNFQPYLNAGGAATKTLADLTATPGKGLLENWTGQFKAPTAAEAAATPGYQFQLQQGENAMQNSAAGRGGLLSGRTLADLNNFAQGTASTNYQNTFNNAFTQYQSAYNTFLNNQNNQYSRLMGISGQGLQAAGGAGNLIQGIGGDIASLYAQQGAAKAAGTIGAANSYGSILPGIASAIGGYTGLSSLNGNNSTGLFADPGLNVMQPSYMPGGTASGTYSLGDLGGAPAVPGVWPGFEQQTPMAFAQ
jgi:hypothetical protein